MTNEQLVKQLREKAKWASYEVDQIMTKAADAIETLNKENVMLKESHKSSREVIDYLRDR